MNNSAIPAGRTNAANDTVAPLRPEPSAKLLPSIAYAPFQIFIWTVIPLLILLWCNFNNFQTISGDLSSGDKLRWTGHLWGLGILAGGYAFLAIIMTLVRAQIGSLVAWLSFFPIVVFINCAVFLLPGTIPWAAHWIIGPDTVMIQNLTGVMPGILFFGALICGGRGKSAAVEMSKALLGFLLVGGIVATGFFWFKSDWIAFSVISCAIVVCTFAVLRLVIVGGSAMFRMSSPGLALVGLWLGVLMPMIGLWVNYFIAFPYDFQVPWIYAFAAINGILLSIPLPSHPLGRRALWFAQCAGFPFSLYFFVVFMPFLPFSVPGLMVWGGGLLVLIPAFVLVLHGFRVIDGFRQVEGNDLTRWATALVALAAVPGVVWWKAAQDRSVLHQALDYVYVASPHKELKFQGEPDALRRTLTHVQEFKAGKRLPLLSTFYNASVFDGLTLPDGKIKQLSRTFLGEEIAIKRGSNLLGRGSRGGFANQSFRMGDPPHTNVELLPVTASYEAEGHDFVRTTATLKMENQERSQGEFSAQLSLPENAAVSGFWLHIEGERVPGRMTEKKASMWVYQMIRDVTRRDPGILRYVAPGQLELRVFPLAGHEVRTVEIEFLAPVSIDQSAEIRGQEIALSDGSSQAGAGVSYAASDAGVTVAIAGEAFSKKLPSVYRKPFLYFIADWSSSSGASAAVLNDAIADARKLFPEATHGNVAMTNFELLPLSEHPLPIDQLGEALVGLKGELPHRGGFSPGRAIHSLLVNYMESLRVAKPGDVAFDQFPVFMIVGGENAIDLAAEELSWLGRMLPDSSDLYVINSDLRGWQPQGFGGAASAGGNFNPVHLFHCGGQNIVAAAKGGAVAHSHGRSMPGVSALQVFDPGRQQFVSVSGARSLEDDEPYARALNLWRRQSLAIADPSATDSASLRDLVVESRDSGILTGATAYIAVESHAQWKMLEEAERKKLKAGKAFELSEHQQISSVPEPSTGILILIAGAVFAMRRRR